MLQGEMPMATGDLIKELCHEVTCPICLEYFNDPVILGCGHNFCEPCLVQYWEGSVMTSSCPQCRGTPLEKGFRINWQLANIVVIVKRLQERKRVKSGNKGVCLIHPEPLKLVCGDDKVLFCMECRRSMKREGHNILPTEKAPQERKEKNLAQLKSLEKEREKLKEQKVTEEQGSQKCPERRAFSPVLDSGSGNHQLQDHAMQRARQVCHLFEQMDILSAQEGRVMLLPQVDRESFPTFKDGDDIPTFFASFEMACSEHGVVGPQRMVLLRSRTSGALAELLLRIPPEKRYDYEYFKGVVEQLFGPSVEDSRHRFRNAQLEPGEKLVAFARRLADDLDAWVEVAEATTFESLRELIAMEQFHKALPANVSSYVRLHNPKTVREAGKLADTMLLYEEEWEPTIYMCDQHPVGNRTEKVAKSKRWGGPAPPSPGAGAAGGRGGPRATSTAQVSHCSYCKEVGHLKRKCPKLAQKQPGRTAAPSRQVIPKEASVAPSAPYYWEWSSDSDLEWEHTPRAPNGGWLGAVHTLHFLP